MPASLYANTRKWYVRFAERPLTVAPVLLAPVVPSRVNVRPPSVETSIAKPVSLVERSDQLKLIWLRETERADRLAGAAGTVTVGVGVGVVTGLTRVTVLNALRRPPVATLPVSVATRSAPPSSASRTFWTLALGL